MDVFDVDVEFVRQVSVEARSPPAADGWVALLAEAYTDREVWAILVGVEAPGRVDVLAAVRRARAE